MMIEKYNAKDLEAFLKKKGAADISELMNHIGTTSRNTVLRKLNELGYQTSYSQNGKFYTLKKFCAFDEDGLWSCRKAWFSIYGTLLETGKQFIDKSERGLSVSELDDRLHVSTKLALLHLIQEERIYREKHDGVFIYFSTNEKSKRIQIGIRSQRSGKVFDNIVDDVLAHEMKAAIILFFTLLDERQRRCFAGLESMKYGRGGDSKVAEILGIDPHTVAKGRLELIGNNFNFENVRAQGGGRSPVKKKRQKS
jgi:hypothetical protein